MTDATTAVASSRRRTLLLLLAWAAAAVVAGIPAAERVASAEPRSVPLVVNTGPECFAGKAAPPAAQD